MAHCAQEGAGACPTSWARSQHLEFGDAPPLELAGSANELLSAMSNLVSNAVRYTPAGGTITMHWRTLADGRGEFSVRDSGPGIARRTHLRA